MNIEEFAYDVKEGLEESEICYIISQFLKDEQLAKVKEVASVPFRVIPIGKGGIDGYMLDPSRCGVTNKENELIHTGSYFECCRFVDKSDKCCKVTLLDPEFEHFCFTEHSNGNIK